MLCSPSLAAAVTHLWSLFIYCGRRRRRLLLAIVKEQALYIRHCTLPGSCATAAAALTRWRRTRTDRATDPCNVSLYVLNAAPLLRAEAGLYHSQ